ncbi:MAG TPA: histidinol-phosphate transaminase [Chloroflexia bacterium]|nr:histidinol-phosphate transaminase [Chloroflexia bacterium]
MVVEAVVYAVAEELVETLAFDTDIEALVRPEILGLESHLPEDTLSIASRRLGMSPEDIVKLDANENPYGCSVRVQELLASFDQYHIYPDPLQTSLRTRLEQYTGVKRERILLANGVSELTDLMMRVFVRPGDDIIICPPTVHFYRLFAGLAGANIVEIPRHPQTFDLQPDLILEAINERTKLILIGSPNNPTGNATSPADLVKLLKSRAIVVVDESFYEFAGTTAAGLVAEFDNLVVMRSFNYWAGLAGLRIAYGLFPQEILKHLWKVKAAYPVTVAQALAAEASLDDERHYTTALNWLKNERGRLFRQLRKLNFLQPFPSQANFLLCHVVRGNAFAVKKRLERSGIFVKYLNSAELPNHLRISVGRPEDTDRLMRSLLTMAEDV